MVKAKLTPKILQKPDRLKEIEFDNYLHEVTVYLNSHQDPGSGYPQASRQFVSPFLYSDQPANLPVDLFRKFVYQADTFKIVTLNITGANIFEYPHFREIIESADSYPFQKKFHLPATGIEKYFPILEALAGGKETLICFYVTFPVDLGSMNHILTFISERNLARKCEFHFIVTSNEEFEASREIIEKAQLRSVFFKPYYTGYNFPFFRDMVFITREDIRHSKPDQFQLFSRISINEKDFGKLTLMPVGSVYANPNDESLGSIETEPLSNIVLNALIAGKSWKRNRKNVTPCRKCLYHFLCPPISSYEILMRRYNFCDIYQKPRNQ
jgi:pseudo-rSAM protein